MRKVSCQDHLGNVFESKKAMADYWGLTPSQLDCRLNKNLSIEKALTLPKKNKYKQPTIIDHLGNKFYSISAMCDYWKISDSTYQGRLAKGMSVEKALTATHDDTHGNSIMDHLGQKFSSTTNMCKHWNISKAMFYGRLKCSWSIEDALTKPKETVAKNSKNITDHEGNAFISVSDMCRYWNIGRSTYNARIKQGWSTKDALTTPQKIKPIKKTIVVDHLGNAYESLAEMCNHYNITRTLYSSRIKLGWSIEKALTTKNRIINSVSIKDYMNREFPTIIDLCNFYGTPEYMLQGKEICDKSLRKIYTHKIKPDTQIGDYHILKILDFPYFMVRHKDQDIICDLEEILNAYHSSEEFYPIPKNKPLKGLDIIKLVQFPYYEVSYENESMIWSYWDIIQYRHDSNFGL